MPRKEPKTRVGRLPGYDPKIADEILARLAEGELAVNLCKDFGLRRATLWDWKRKNKQFAELYARAREDQLECWADEIVHTAKDDSKDILQQVEETTLANGDTITKTKNTSDNTAVNRHRLEVDAKKWVMCKLVPDKYGDKVQSQLTGANGEALNITVNIGPKKIEK